MPLFFINGKAAKRGRVRRPAKDIILMLSGKKPGIFGIYTQRFLFFLAFAFFIHKNKKMKKVKLTISCLSQLLLLLCIISPLQELSAQDIPDQNLKEVIISATRQEQIPDSIGRSIILITKKQIEENQYRTLGDVLSSQSGISTIGSYMNPGMSNSLFMRGTNSNHTVIMIDGVRITDPSSVNNAGDLSEITLAGIEKIEIVKGTSSSLHGSSAIGGVINLITDRSNKKEGINTDVLLQAMVFGESSSEINTNLGLGYKFKNGFYVDGRYNQIKSNGIDATVDTVSDPNAYKKRDLDDYMHRDMIAGAGFSSKKFNVNLRVKKTLREVDLDKRAYTDDDNYKLEFDRNLLTYGLAYNDKKWKLSLNGGYTSMNREAIDDSSKIDEQGNFDQTFVKDNYDGTNIHQEIQIDHKRLFWNVIAGGTYDKETMSARNYIYANSQFGLYEATSDLDSLNLNTNSIAVFSRLELDGKLFSSALDGLVLAIGGRSTQHSEFGNNLTYEINPSYKLNKESILFMNIASGYNSPSLYQLYAPENYYTSAITRGNPDLDPETSLNFEFGFRKVNDGNRINVSIHRTAIKNTIEYVYLWDKLTSIENLGNDWMRDDYRGDAYINAGETVVHGIDVSIQHELNNRLTAEVALSLIEGNTEYKASDNNSDHTQGNHVQLFSNGSFLTQDIQIQGLTRRPSTGRISLNYTFSKSLNMRMDVKMVGSRNDIYYDSNLGPFGALSQTAIATYTLLDLSGRYKINDHIYAGFKLGNLTDEKYSEIRGFSTLGRTISLSLKYALAKS